MKQRLLLALLCTGVAVGGWAIWVSACDQDKQTSASAATQSAKSAKCPYHSSATSATTASMTGCPHDASKMSATTASMTGSCAHDGAKASATTASFSGCSHGANASAMTASISGCSHDANGSFTTAGMGGHDCNSAKNAAAKNGASCAMHATTATTTMHEDCDACSGVATCQEQLRSAGAEMQVVPLKNGVMYVYTAESAANVRAIQSALARRTSRLTAIESSGDRAKLCPECKMVRGAIASGKLTRETVNIEGGCLTLMTSDDAAMVAKLHSMAGIGNARAKS